MHVRDSGLVDDVAARPFSGYALHGVAVPASAVERIAACLALVATMVLSGILLGVGPERGPRR